MHHYKKEILTNPVRVNGAVVQFQPVGANTGVVELDAAQHGPIIAALEQHADKQRMGIVRLSLEQYDSLKKNGLRERQHQSLPNQIKTVEPVNLLPQSKKSSAAAAPVGEPLPPRTGPRTITASPELQALLQEQGQPIPPPVTIEPKPALPKPKAAAKRGRKSDLEKPPQPTAGE